MKRGKLGARERERGKTRSYERQRSERAKQRPTGANYSTIGLTHRYFACRPISYSLVNRFLFRADQHSSWEAGYTREMARQERVFLAPRCNRVPLVYSLGAMNLL
jgi:hypothetical protein